MIKVFRITFLLIFVLIFNGCGENQSGLIIDRNNRLPGDVISDTTKSSGTADGSGGDTRFSSEHDILEYFKIRNGKVILTQKVQNVFHRLIKLKEVLDYYHSLGAPPLHRYDKVNFQFHDPDLELDIEDLFNYFGISVTSTYSTIFEDQKLLSSINTILEIGSSDKLVSDVSTIDFTNQQEACITEDARETAMAVNSEGQVCVSIGLLQMLPVEALEVEIVSLAVHEYIHFLGIESEEPATLVQGFIAVNKDYFIKDHSLHEVGEIQDKLVLGLTSNLAHYSSIRSQSDERKARCDGLYKAIKLLQSDSNYFLRNLVGSDLDSLLSNYCFSQGTDSSKIQIIKFSETIYGVINKLAKAKIIMGSILSPFYNFSNEAISEFAMNSIQLDRILVNSLDDDGKWKNQPVGFDSTYIFYLKIEGVETVINPDNCGSVKDPFLDNYGSSYSAIRENTNPLQPNLCSVYELNSRQNILFVLSPHSTDGLIEVGFRERPATYDFFFDGIFNLRLFITNKEEPTAVKIQDYPFEDLSSLPIKLEPIDDDLITIMNKRVFSEFDPFYTSPGVISFIQSIFPIELNKNRTLKFKIPEVYDAPTTKIEYSHKVYEVEFGFKQD